MVTGANRNLDPAGPVDPVLDEYRPPPCGGAGPQFPSRQQKKQLFAASSWFQVSPLTDSNRRPPPYHRAARREARASAGTRGHESPARRRKRPKTSDRAWTRAPALMFPHCSLAHRCASGASGSSITTRELRQEHGWTSLSVPEASDDRGPTKGRFDQVTATAPTPARWPERWCLSEARRRPCRVGKAGRRQSSAPCRRRRGRPNGSSRARTRRGTSGSGR